MTNYSREVTVTTHYQSTGSKNAKGGYVVPRHAVGGYYDRPTLIPGVGMIGENGREYYDGSKIVPITNHQYADPLADTIAARMAQRGAGAGRISAGDYVENVFALWAYSYVYQSEADRAAHKAVPIQCALTLAGSLDSVVITVNVRV